MYLYWEFKDREFEILTAMTPKYFTVGLSIHWNSTTRKNIGDLSHNCYVLDFHFLCFNLAFNLCGKLLHEVG